MKHDGRDTAEPAKPHCRPFAWWLPRGIRQADIDSLERAAISCEQWEIACAIIVAVAVCAEVVIALLHPAYDSTLERYGSAAASAFIALGIAGEVFFSRSDGRLQTELRDRSNKELASAKRELARIMTARSSLLSAAAAEGLIATIAPFRGTRFCIGMPTIDREAWDFVWLLEPILDQAGWIFLDWTHGSPHGGVFRKQNWKYEQHVYGVANVLNVNIELHPDYRETLLPAAEALVAAFSAIGIDAVTSGHPISGISAAIDAIHILVGNKR